MSANSVSKVSENILAVVCWSQRFVGKELVSFVGKIPVPINYANWTSHPPPLCLKKKYFNIYIPFRHKDCLFEIEIFNFMSLVRVQISPVYHLLKQGYVKLYDLGAESNHELRLS